MSRKKEADGDDPLRGTRRDFCTGLVVGSAGLVLMSAGVSEVIAAQDSMVAYPPRRIESAETLLPGSNLYFNYPTRNDRLYCCALPRVNTGRTAEGVLTQGVPWMLMRRIAA